LVNALKLAIERMHGGRATWESAAAVREEHGGRVVWEGEVQVYALEGHAQAERAYAWEEPPEREGAGPRVFAVLAVDPIRTAADAVKASIAARHRGKAGR
jgi:hypothetical protein